MLCPQPAYHPEGSARASQYLINVRYVSCSSDGHRHRLSETGQPEHASSSPTIDPQLLEEDTELETSSPVHSAPIALARGHRNPLYAARGGLAHRNPGRNVATENNKVDDAPYAPDPLAVKDESDPLSLLKTRHEDLDLVQRQARRIVLNIVGQQFRLVTGVSKHDKWPKWGQQMPGMAVNFEARVDESVNPDLLVRVAEVSMQQLKNHSVIHATWMNAPNVKLTYSLLRECAKTSFRGFRAAYNSQVDQEKARQRKKNERASRWQNRRNKKSDNLYSVAPRYLELHGVDPGHLVTADLMSDEASGPEDDSNEDAVTEWRRQMAEKAGITGKSDSQLAKLSFFEVIRPNWRSNELTKIHRELAEIHNSSLHPKSLRMMVERVRDTGRSSDKIPGYAPFNFGVNIEWYERMKETDSRFLGDWMKHPDPPGFGENTTPTDDGTGDPSAT
ncbi:hypothetical protein DICSQDRAFT_129553 [Dichomitus squalens LYAD-421 SS1]|uniref:Uncharacterized protein n=1 Tax=Dichomitus squalens (strain LYAD-421) TaxID=732165 RepID=R7SN41_DICSQ|nr:uncharacterized protein DICSQDRAFT_129553 [Dichomitus squalens LYAD-421 SS1]EJF57318.1 hypothetical protein DICSQDRAFT_129553 [Dichomitus squalens LYAD-421 SS1]